MELSNHIPTKNIFHTFLNPETKVSADAFSVHGYSDEFLSNKPKFKDVAKDFLNFIKDKKLIIHNADFDLGFLNNELIKFSNTLEKVCVASVEKGYMTKDLAILINKDAKYQTTTEFLETIIIILFFLYLSKLFIIIFSVFESKALVGSSKIISDGL